MKINLVILLLITFVITSCSLKKNDPKGCWKYGDDVYSIKDDGTFSLKMKYLEPRFGTWKMIGDDRFNLVITGVNDSNNTYSIVYQDDKQLVVKYIVEQTWEKVDCE